ncbi:MAG: nucleotidyltransferase domain-containing protein [Aquabacterium sp.]
MGSIRQADAEKPQRDQRYGLASGDGKGGLKLGRSSGGNGLQMTGSAAMTFSSDVDTAIADSASKLPTYTGGDDWDAYVKGNRASSRQAVVDRLIDQTADSLAQKAVDRARVMEQRAAAASVRNQSGSITGWDGGAGGGRGGINPSLAASQQGGGISFAQAIGLPAPEKTSLLSPGFVDRIFAGRSDGYQSLTAWDPRAEQAREAGLARTRTDLGLIIGGVTTGYASAARMAGAPDQVVNNLAIAEFGVTTSVSAPFAAQGSVVPRVYGSLDIPQGISGGQFGSFSSNLKSVMEAENLPPGQTFVQGSRANGTAKPGSSDIDILHVVSDEHFDSLVQQRLSETTGKNQAQINQYATEQQRLPARSISRTFESALWEDVYPTLPSNDVTKIQFSIVKESSGFKNGPLISIP